MWSFLWLFVLEAVVIVLANAATIVIFTRTPRLHSKQYIMIISQAVADLFIGLVSVPMFIAVKKIDVEYPHTFVRVYYGVEGFFGAASLFGLATLAIERTHATYFPFRHSALSQGPYVAGIMSTWTVPLIVAIPWSFPSLGKDNSIHIKMGFSGLIFFVICVGYSLIVAKVRCTTAQNHVSNIQENKKLTVTLAVVTILSLAMWLPYHVMALNRAIIETNKTSPFVYFPAKFLMYGNSLVNSVVYAFRMREIKREILRVFPCFGKRHNQVSTTDESEL